MPKLPLSGTWLLAPIVGDPPFNVIEVDLVNRRGSVRKREKTEPLRHVMPGFGEIDQTIPDRFHANYSFEGHHGRIEAIIDDRGDLKVNFTGTINDHWTARSSKLEWRADQAKSARVMDLSYTERLSETLKRSLPLMPAEAAQQVKQLITPASLSIMAGTTAVWAVSHFFGVGEIADLILIVAGSVMLGATAADIAKELGGFAKYSLGAESESDLDEGAQHFANAVVKGGLNLISTILLRRFAQRGQKPFRENYVKPWTPAAGPPLNSTPGKWFYRRRFIRDRPDLRRSGPMRGNTSSEGDVWVSNRPQDYRGASHPMALERLKTYRHESFHSFLTPKLQLLRNLRVQLREGAYAKSHLLRYLEEALAEAWGRLGTVGDLPRAISFPIDKGYVTLGQMGQEAAGIAEGAVNVGGTIYRVFFDHGSSDKKVRFTYDDVVAEQEE